MLTCLCQIEIPLQSTHVLYWFPESGAGRYDCTAFSGTYLCLNSCVLHISLRQKFTISPTFHIWDCIQQYALSLQKTVTLETGRLFEHSLFPSQTSYHFSALWSYLSGRNSEILSIDKVLEVAHVLSIMIRVTWRIPKHFPNCRRHRKQPKWLEELTGRKKVKYFNKHSLGNREKSIDLKDISARIGWEDTEKDWGQRSWQQMS